MARSDSSAGGLHEDVDLFREAVNFTADQTGFVPRLIEKDYFCTLLLRHFAEVPEVIFKGGTCLAKVHAEFFRLSEDMDFAISISTDAARPIRRKRAEPLRRAIAALPAPFRVTATMEGHNNSTHYNGTVSYLSLLGGHHEPIFIELSLREPLLMPPVEAAARTILLDPISGGPLVPPVRVQCIASREAFAEKFRAALSRREVAIRDFFDLDHAVQRHHCRPDDPVLVTMVSQKLAIPGNELVNVGAVRLAQLRGQLAGRLRPVLRAQDFAAFDLERAIEVVLCMAKVWANSRTSMSKPCGTPTTPIAKPLATPRAKASAVSAGVKRV